MPFKIALVFAAAMAFTYVGYPALLFLISRLAGRRAREQHSFPLVSVILPVYDEGARLGAKVDNIISQDYPSDRLEIVVVDDGGSDYAPDHLRDARLAGVNVISLPRRLGKASALNAGIEAARGEVLVFTDARQEIAAGSIRALAARFADPDVAAVTGRLAVAGGGAEGMYRRYEETLRSWEGRCGAVAGATGALYAVRRRAVGLIPAETILDDLVISVAAAAKGRFLYEPQAVALEPSESAARTWNRRIRTLAGNWQLLLHPVRYRRIFSLRTIVPLICHKALRLFFPLFAVGFLLCVAAGGAGAVVAVPVVALSAVIVAAAILAGGPAATIVEIAASLVVAPVGALARYLSGRESVLWARH
ncbi:MAG: glycosyltransferase [Planctomycetes bacterium]|nr:glycosyltransferase [Planctomycetota bacterium]